MNRVIPALVTAIAVQLIAASAHAEFPQGFLWGTAISAFQTDMGGTAPEDPNTDWWVWTRDATNITDGVVSGDLPEAGPGFYDTFASDIELANRRLRNNALRFGIEWSRIFPTTTAGVDASGGITLAVLQQLDAIADQAAVAHYRDVLQELRDRAMVPFVTLSHFSLPLWIHDPIATRDAFDGVGGDDPIPTGFGPAGWLDAAIVPEFEKYAAYLAWKLGDLVDYWTPLNEPVVVASSGFVNLPGVLSGNFPPGVFTFTGTVAVLLNEVAAQAAAYDALNAWDTSDADGDGDSAKIGLVHNMVVFRPEHANDPDDVAGAQHAAYIFNRLWLNATINGDLDIDVDGVVDEHRPEYTGKADFVGVNYYLLADARGLGSSLTPQIVLLDFIPKISFTQCFVALCSDLGWQAYPQGLAEVLTTAASYGLPLYVTENGIADAGDKLRRPYLAQHLAVLEQAIGDGLDVRGYFHWSLVDNFEWAIGYDAHFGLSRYDPLTLERRLRSSARVLPRTIRKNTVPPGLLRRYPL
jgi:beta-glucosidase/6-phospho-beta-glucosidase/beta-galactosidase